jgi:hypothetical protein
MATSRKIFRDPTPAAVVTVHDQVVTGSHVADDCIDHIVDELSGNPVLTHGGTAGSARYVGADFVPPTSGISFQELLPFPATTHPPSDVQIVGLDFAILPFAKPLRGLPAAHSRFEVRIICPSVTVCNL